MRGFPRLALRLLLESHQSDGRSSSGYEDLLLHLHETGRQDRPDGLGHLAVRLLHQGEPVIL